MIGALSTARGLLHTSCFVGSNTVDTFLPFLIALKEKCQDSKAIVVMDNLKVHHSKLLLPHFNDYFTAKFLPPQSCALNPIEQVWNVIKGQWRKTAHMVLDVGKKKDD